ncbi:cytochrome P450, family 5, subfamily A [Exophiala viscosa]|uniref:cytochrome P450, family 5, subfamily A n=1 Tax=Exophiala viscosa TaxID=2486360 RepID=UPI002199A7E0|nr:cytochrome P450, family 5, subfamily A [Exophiala viscosa]
MFLLVFLSLILAYFLWALVRLFNNYQEVKKIGLPIIILPVDPASPLWMFTKDYLRPVLTQLPFGLGTWAGRAEVGWTYSERYSVHAKHGDAFILVSPGENDITLADPAATEDVMRRRNDFIKNPAMYGMLNIYGENVDTVNGKLWDRHRKITVPPFNEQNSALVWRESAEQADQMLEVWSGKASVTSTQPDIHAVALNVLCGAGFGLHSSFVDATVDRDAQSRDPTKRLADPKRQRLGYRESLQMLLANILPLVILGLTKRSRFPEWLYFGSLAKLSIAYDEFKGYMGEMLAREKMAFEQGDLTRHNLMSALVRASMSEQPPPGSSSNEHSMKGPTKSTLTSGFTDDEVYGNLFIFNLAGHDTTAATLHFAITLLAADPRWQSWIAEEIDAVRNADGTGTFYYEETFPKLTRVLALMYETLRLYGPVVVIPRYTGDTPQRLVIQGKERIVPARTTVSLNVAALNTHPRYWGNDPLVFRPDRWTVSDNSGTSSNDNNDSDVSWFQPVPGSFIPWSHGPRVCPGRKFSQVEFTRVMFGLFSHGTRVEVVRQGSETEIEAQARVMRVVNEAKLEVTLKMVGADRAALKWVKKDSLES